MLRTTAYTATGNIVIFDEAPVQRDDRLSTILKHVHFQEIVWVVGSFPQD